MSGRAREAFPRGPRHLSLCRETSKVTRPKRLFDIDNPQKNTCICIGRDSKLNYLSLLRGNLHDRTVGSHLFLYERDQKNNRELPKNTRKLSTCVPMMTNASLQRSFHVDSNGALGKPANFQRIALLMCFYIDLYNSHPPPQRWSMRGITLFAKGFFRYRRYYVPP